MEMHRYEKGSVSMYPHRPLAEASHDAVDVVELASRSTDRVPNVRHLQVLHTYSSVTSLAFLIQQDVEVVDEFRQHDGVATVTVK
jgi:hypothetical protein